MSRPGSAGFSPRRRSAAGAQTALRYVALDGTDHASHKQQGSKVRRHTTCWNKHPVDIRLRILVPRANVA
ncbi:hypothetical protein [Streptomyces sp. NRRL S-337]|uniref:hypothetical protein n=1 Tax=Streptomyces sp. NRRL S-337 TaxID=1463900 RepID=UPI000A9A27F7|nr:hypothetical protein [Streptomyces sp. NRRL S-337]